MFDRFTESIKLLFLRVNSWLAQLAPLEKFLLGIAILAVLGLATQFGLLIIDERRDSTRPLAEQ